MNLHRKYLVRELIKFRKDFIALYTNTKSPLDATSNEMKAH